MALITCPDCETEVSDAALTCIKCGRPLAQTKPVNHPAPRKRQTHPVSWVILIALLSVGAYKFYFSAETKQAINRVAANTGVTITPWIDRAQSGLEVLLNRPDQRVIFGKSISGTLHPTGEFKELLNHRIGRSGNILQLELTTAWNGGFLGTPYTTTIVWECSEKGPIKTVVTKDDGPFGFQQENLDVLDKWFRTEIWPVVDRNAGS